jgi:phage gpG-like protein
MLRTQLKINTKLLKQANEKQIHDYLMRLAAYTMKTAQRSMRYRKPGGKPSLPGQPPRAARNNPLLRKVWDLFSVQKSPPKIIVGPKDFKTMVPAVHEFGGYLKIGRKRKAKYAARPYLIPAFQKALQNVKLKKRV